MTTQRTTSRRDFLKTVGIGAAAAALAAPTIIPASALGAEGTTPPSDRITLGFIGIGKQGEGHMRGLVRHKDIQVLAICEVYKMFRDMAVEHVEKTYADAKGKGQYKGCKGYVDYYEMIARPDIDAVLIATPDHQHAIPAVAAARAGKDIYCEKPMTLTIREARAMVQAVRRYGRVFQTGSQQRSDREFLRACELVRNGFVGKVKEVYVGVGGPSSPCVLPAQPTPEGLDWDRWLGPAPYRPFHEILRPPNNDNFPNWRAYRDYSGGGMTDWGAHHFDIAQWGLGMDESGPVEITPPDGKDVKYLTYRYASGIPMYHGGPGGITFIGTEGEVFVTRGQITAKPASILAAQIKPDGVQLYRSPGHHQDWINCMRSRRRPICDVEVGCRSVSVCHLGNIAYWLKRPLKWDPAKETFVGDEEANRWLSRAYREPWTL
jgi:predicted dehydrogenase